MLQRIQSVYLLLVSVLMAVAAISPLAIFKDAQGNLLEMRSLGVFLESQKVLATWGVVSIMGLITLLAFICIFLYKNRKKQIVICSVNTVLILFLYVTIAVYSCSGQGSANIDFQTVQYGVVLPFISLIFNVLAQLKIKSDEKLVRSLDRIR
ncbi:DUF4293 family protein [Dysgonomonas sp. 216]|uniref:DUF4293 domain-containing protein n=1 Tax=Dysgonomonas sp. 216 TaxID=2302934 RepID=UPI0013D6A69D|nr:DUF4293 domain-containing protein [Dysgonomonas sp. 216]NDW17379.1 DUF4293 family protein [Dysgonomonas sp. 216]